jgi:adenylate cyclase
MTRRCSTRRLSARSKASTNADVGDFFATPFDRVVPGVEIQATAIANLLADDGLVRSALVRWIDAGAAVALPCIAVILMARRRAFAGLSIAVLAFAVWVAVCFVAAKGCLRDEEPE